VERDGLLTMERGAQFPQPELIGTHDVASGPYRGTIREGKLHISHVSEPEHVIESVDAHSDNAHDVLKQWHANVEKHIK